MHANTLIRARGIVHCHSQLSFDSQTTISELRDALVGAGFSFVALTEHVRDLTQAKYASFVDECKCYSDERFVVIPGLEFRCEAGIEIAGLWLNELVTFTHPEDAVRHVRERNGYAIWVHPLKRSGWSGLLDCDAVEAFNCKMDGPVAPNLRLLNYLKRARSEGKPFHIVFGLDLHNLNQPLSAWLECNVSKLSAENVISALRAGQFSACTKHIRLESDGTTTFPVHARMYALRAAYLAWNWLLGAVPIGIRKKLISGTRGVVRQLHTKHGIEVNLR